MNTATRIHRNGQQHIVDLAHTVRQLWCKMCEHDGIEPNASFVIFSDDNPYQRFHDAAMNQYFEAVSQYQAGGYVGLQIKNGKSC